MKVFLDYDGTLVDTCEAWLKWINSEFGREFKVDEVDTWDWFNRVEEREKIPVFEWFNKGVYCTEAMEVKHFDGARYFVRELSKEYDVTILTATHCESLIEQKDLHIKKIFGDIQIIHDFKKEDYASNNGNKNVLVDDKEENCIKFADNGGISILFNHDCRYSYVNNKNLYPGVLYASSYDEVLSILEGLDRKHEITIPSTQTGEMEEDGLRYAMKTSCASC